VVAAISNMPGGIAKDAPTQEISPRRGSLFLKTKCFSSTQQPEVRNLLARIDDMH
jgi:hypothetical protein